MNDPIVDLDIEITPNLLRYANLAGMPGPQEVKPKKAVAAAAGPKRVAATASKKTAAKSVKSNRPVSALSERTFAAKKAPVDTPKAFTKFLSR